MKTKKFKKVLLFCSVICVMLPINIQANEESELEIKLDNINREYPYPAKTPEEFIDRTIALLDLGYYRYEKDTRWVKTYNKIQEEKGTIGTVEEAIELLIPIVFVAGGKHSLFTENTTMDYYKLELSKKGIVEQEQYTEDLYSNRISPTYSFYEGILELSIPQFMYFNSFDNFKNEYISKIHEGLKIPGIKGVIIDLRYNVGGNLEPMIKGLLPLIPEGRLLTFVDQNGYENHIETRGKILDNQGVYLYADHEKLPKVPIAVLTSEWTASSGEALLMCLMDLENVKTFGQATAGYASGNDSFEVSQEYDLILTIGMNKTRNGHIFYEDPIQPDVTSNYPIDDAREWLLNEIKLY